MEKSAVKNKIVEIGVIPVVRAASSEQAIRVIEAIRRGGIDVFEITMTVPNAISLIETLCLRYGSDFLIGAGTVLSAATARQCVDAGAKFVISPAFDMETVEYCKNQQIVTMPGALTPTEIVTAWNAGADFVKVFPAGALGGANYLKSLKAPLPHIELIPTGGVSLGNAGDFIRAGASAIGVGADLVDLTAINENRANEIIERARLYLEIVQAARFNL